MFKRLAKFLNPPPPNSYIWHECTPPYPPRSTVDGAFTRDGQPTWRRITADGWEYRQDGETAALHRLPA
jgi:hypothetical protein